LACISLVEPDQAACAGAAITAVCPEAAVAAGGGGNAEPKCSTLMIAAIATSNVTTYKQVSLLTGVIVNVLATRSRTIQAFIGSASAQQVTEEQWTR
jgi:hypothetical protein